MLALRWNLVSIFVIRANQVIYTTLRIIHDRKYCSPCWLFQSYIKIILFLIVSCKMIATRSCEEVHGGLYLTSIHTSDQGVRKWLITILPDL